MRHSDISTTTTFYYKSKYSKKQKFRRPYSTSLGYTQMYTKIADNLIKAFRYFSEELLTGIGPVTSALPMRRSTD